MYSEIKKKIPFPLYFNKYIEDNNSICNFAHNKKFLLDPMFINKSTIKFFPLHTRCRFFYYEYYCYLLNMLYKIFLIIFIASLGTYHFIY